MTIDTPRTILKGKKALVVGVANEHSIAYGCAKAFRELGADLAITYLNDKARRFVEPLGLRGAGRPISAAVDQEQRPAGERRDGVRERAPDHVRRSPTPPDVDEHGLALVGSRTPDDGPVRERQRQLVGRSVVAGTDLDKGPLLRASDQSAFG